MIKFSFEIDKGFDSVFHRLPGAHKHHILVVFPNGRGQNRTYLVYLHWDRRHRGRTERAFIPDGGWEDRRADRQCHVAAGRLPYDPAPGGRRRH